MRTRVALLVALVVAFAVPGALASASGHVRTVVTFDPAAGEFPEGIAVDKTGDIYVSMILLDEIRRIDPSGTQHVVARFSPGTAPGGLAIDASGALYVAASALDLQTGQTDPELRGVYRVGRDGIPTRLPGSGDIPFPNDVTLDKRGNVYATDTSGGAVWRIPRGGSAELWAQDPLLEGDGSFGFGFPIGANGIAVRHNRVVVANTEGGLLVTIPIEPGGGAGDPTLLARAAALVGADGIAFDVLGSVYVASAAQNTVVRVAPDGSIETLATADDGLNQPSTLAFGAGRLDRRALFVANFSLFSPEPTPGVLTLPAGSPGQPVP